MFDQITNVLSGAWWAYPLVLAVCAGDAVLPLLPSETILVTGGVLGHQGVMIVWLVLVFGAAGALLGDLTSYAIGHWAGPWAKDRLFRGAKGKKTYDWAGKQLHERGSSILVIGRFVPGGRTAITFVAGVTGYPIRRFLAVDAMGATIWAAYATLLGFLGGAAFEDNTGLALVVAFALALVGAGLIEGGRHLVGRRRKRRSAAEQTAS